MKILYSCNYLILIQDWKDNRTFLNQFWKHIFQYKFHRKGNIIDLRWKNYKKWKSIQINENSKVGKSNISHNIRPMSMYSPRMENSCYYYSSVFSDYSNEDFKSFCNKMPILKAKLKINSGKLKKEYFDYYEYLNYSCYY